MKPNIFIVGPSGSGKSTSLRNLDPKTTVVLNTEQKALPFKGGQKFKLNIPIANMVDFHVAFNKALESKIAKVIVIESFTSMVEQQYAASSKSYTGFDLWDDYKSEIKRILNLSKATDKYVIFLGLDAVLEGANGVEERYILVQGSLKKTIEKEFVMVLYTDVVTDAEGTKHVFITNKQKGYEHTGIKSPMDMLPQAMPNDLAEVIKSVEAYYEDDSEDEEPQVEPETPTDVEPTVEELNGINN